MGLISSLVVLCGGLSIAIFFYGIVRFVANAGDQKGHQAGYRMMLWGLIALFVFFSLAAIIDLMCVQFFAAGSCHQNNQAYTGGAAT